MKDETQTILLKFNIIIYIIWIIGFILVSFTSCFLIFTNSFPIILIIFMGILSIFIIWLSTTLLEGFACVIRLLLEIKYQNEK